MANTTDVDVGHVSYANNVLRYCIVIQGRHYFGALPKMCHSGFEQLENNCFCAFYSWQQIFLTALDDFSRFTWIILLKSKSESREQVQMKN
ncbi:hypothetical protein MTR_8g015140 [Medicago truncatula]|uniref:Uncharacterized protein n=1 Tax=Medicago truncatula TaxID=3880 RepID=A0A072TN13_MEDTR|nr:hypothetical protein MTR_8g015140 [Medicago truncatula]